MSETATAEPSINELRQMIANPAPEPEPVVEAAPAATPAVAEPAPAQEPVVVQERDEHGKFVTKELVEEIPIGAQKAIDKEVGKAVRARRETERLNARLEEQLRRLEEATPPAAQNTPPKPVPAAAVGAKSKPVMALPKIEDYEYDTEKHEAAKAEAIAKYSDELTDWKLEQRDLQRQVADQQKTQQTATQTRAQKIQDKLDEGRKEFADFDDLVLDKDAPITETMLDLIVDSPVGPKIAHALGSNREELTRISKLSPTAQAYELGKIEAKLTPAPSAAAPRAAASPKAPLPKPPVVVGTGGSPSDVDLDTCDMRAFSREVGKILHPGR